MSLDRLYQKYAGTPETATKWPWDNASWPPHGQPVTPVVVGNGHDGHGGHGQMQEQPQSTVATHDEVEAILAGLAAAGRDLDTVEPVARWTMQSLSREAAAELAVALDDAFTVANDDKAARWQCRRLLKNPQALEAAKAVWPDLPTPDSPVFARPTGRPAVDQPPRWLRLIRERCPLLPEDETHIRRHLGRLMPGDALALAERYAAVWEQAAQAEQRPAARDNAGRRAANAELRGGKRHARQ